MLSKKPAKSALERVAPFHWWLPGNKEDDVFGQKTEDGVDVTFGGCAVPKRDQITYGLLVSVHKTP